LTQIPKPPVQGGFCVSDLLFQDTGFRQGRAASILEEVPMVHFDFDVVSDPLPPKRIPPQAGTPGAARKQGENSAPASSGDGGEERPVADEAV
jgi:hypothetical protein